MAGRKPKPTAIKKLTGNPGKRPLPEREPQPSVGNLHRPEHLDEIACREWERLEPILSGMKVLTDADYLALALLCQQTSTWIRAKEEVERDGMTIEGRRHPLLTLISDAAKNMGRCMSELGLTPAARVKVKTVDPHEGESPWNRFTKQDDAPAVH